MVLIKAALFVVQLMENGWTKNEDEDAVKKLKLKCRMCHNDIKSDDFEEN